MSKPVVVADIEVYHDYFLAAFKRLSDGKVISIEMSSRTPREEDDQKRARIRAILRNHRVVTFNGMNYDMPLLWYFVCGADNRDLKRASDMIINTRIRYWEVEDALGIKIPYAQLYGENQKDGIDHIDLFEPQPNPFASLKILNGRLHGRKMQDLPIEPDARLSHSDMDLLTTYCGNDLDATEIVDCAIADPLQMREAFSIEYGIDFRSKSDAQMGEAMIKCRVEQIIGERVKKVTTPAGTTFSYNAPDYIKFKNPELNEILRRLRDTEFYVQGNGKVDLPGWLEGRKITIGESTYAMGIGGLHSTESNRAVHSDDDHILIDFDVASYYPAIILNSGLYPRALGRHFLDVYRAIRDERVAAKKRAKVIKDVDLPTLRDLKADSDDAKDQIKKRYKALDKELADCITKDKGLKIAINGTFGKLGSVYSVLYAPHLMIFVTLTGQLSLLMLIDRLENAGFSVVSANTDGIVVRPRRDRAGMPIKNDRLSGDGELRDIIEQWERDTEFALEATEYESLYNQSVNSYIAVKPNGKVKIKGPLSTPRHEGDMRGQLMKNPQMDIVSLAVVALITKGIPLDETIRGSTDIRDFVTVVKVDGGATWRGEYLGKVVRYYWAKGGEEILKKKPHATTGNHAKVPRTDGCRPLMELPDEFPGDIDYDRYVDAAREALMDIGYTDRPPVIKPIRVWKHSAILWWAVAA